MLIWMNVYWGYADAECKLGTYVQRMCIHSVG